MRASTVATLRCVVALWFVVAQAAAQTPSANRASTRGTPARPRWTLERTPWGDPDLQAVWSGDAATGIPIQRPPQLGTKAELTDAEFAEKREQDARARKRGEDAIGTMRIDSAWLDRSFRQTSLVVDPPDGRIPPLLPGAEARRTPVGTYGNGPFDSPQDFTLYDRCVTLGVVGTMVPRVYGNGFRIVQAPGNVAIMAEMIHEARVIPLDGRPHIGEGVRTYLGDSRGRWEGDTLVIETTNLNGKIPANFNGRTAADRTWVLPTSALKIVERITRVESDLLRYEATIDDPGTFTHPYTMVIPLTSPPGYRMFPYECHEGNMALRQALGAERAEDRALEEDAKRGIIRPRRAVQGELTVTGQPIQ